MATNRPCADEQFQFDSPVRNGPLLMAPAGITVVGYGSGSDDAPRRDPVRPVPGVVLPVAARNI